MFFLLFNDFFILKYPQKPLKTKRTLDKGSFLFMKATYITQHF